MLERNGEERKAHDEAKKEEQQEEEEDFFFRSLATGAGAFKFSPLWQLHQTQSLFLLKECFRQWLTPHYLFQTHT